MSWMWPGIQAGYANEVVCYNSNHQAHHCKQPQTNTAHFQLWQHWWEDSHTDNHSPANHDGTTGTRNWRLLWCYHESSLRSCHEKARACCLHYTLSTFCTSLYFGMYQASSLQTQGTKGSCMLEPCCVSLYSQEPKKDLTPWTRISRLHCNWPASLFTSTLQMEAVHSSKSGILKHH